MRVPISWTMRHRYAFSSDLPIGNAGLASAADWDLLRLSDAEPAFQIASSRTEWAATAESNPELVRRAGLLAEGLRARAVEQVVSPGVGTGALEYLLMRASPQLRLRCGDFAPGALEILRAHFTASEAIERMDLADPVWANGAECVLLNRVDMELDDETWRHVFATLDQRHVAWVILVPCGLLTIHALLREVIAAGSAVARRRRLRHAGYLRTAPRMDSLFSTRYLIDSIEISGDLPIWWLRRRA